MTATAYPLAWPHHRPRTPAAKRKPGAFRSTPEDGSYRRFAPIHLPDARQRLADEMDRIRASHVLLSTNLELRLDGKPRAGLPEPADPGVALYFQLAGKPIVLACDRYDTVAANMAAIAAHLDATRTIERHGVGTLEQLFAGFAALPPAGKQPWRAVLGFRADAAVTPDDIKAKRRDLARLHHADAGGAGNRMAEINAAADDALKELGA